MSENQIGGIMTFESTQQACIVEIKEEEKAKSYDSGN